MTKGQRTRKRSVAEDRSLFNRRGSEAGSMSMLMEATGLERSGIYRHFSSKEEVAAETFDYAWTLTLGARMQDVGGISDSIDKVSGSLRSLFTSSRQFPAAAHLLNTAVDADDGNPVLRERVRQGLHDWRDRLRAIVNAGIKRREIRPGVDAKE